MSGPMELPGTAGQLVWSPADPTMGVGLVTEVEGSSVRVRFLRLNEERVYTTRRADCAIVRYRIEPGERVRDHDGNEHRVAKLVESHNGLALYELEDGTELSETQLVPDIRDIGAKERLATLSLVHPEVVKARMQGLELARLGDRPGVASILGARVQWLPHQIDVATRAIQSDPVRLLLADEVGLGKTVEAALIYSGLRAEGRASRVLILTPDSLCIQWLGEIYRKAHELPVLLDDERLDEANLHYEDLSPFEAFQRIVASVDRVAGSRQLTAQAVNADWDLVVVDEAHHLRWSEEAGGNHAYRLVERLAKKTRHLLLLTATPMALDPAEYHALLRLLDPHRFEDPASFGTVQKRVAAIGGVARAIVFAMEEVEPLSIEVEDEARVLLGDDAIDLQQLEEFLALEPNSPDREEASEVVLESLRERHGLTEYVVRNRRGPVGGLPQRIPQVCPLEPLELQDILIDIGENVVMELAESIDDPVERYEKMGRMLRALWATPGALLDIVKSISPVLLQQLKPHVEAVVRAPADAEGLPTGDARLRWLIELIRDSSEKTLVFVESSIAVRALKLSLGTFLGGNIAVFHRDLPPRDQDRQVAWFRDPSGPKVMLSTEAGGEGRNFQFCHRVVLYDLPWRPATIEQRIGRIDRVGQSKDVEVFVPYFRSGYEAAILKVMQKSIGVLDRTVGGIDHSLEYVASRLAELVYEGGGVEQWQALYEDTETLVDQARERIEDATDPILDHASFSPERVDQVLSRVPDDLPELTEAFVRGYADHSRLNIVNRDNWLVDVDGAPSASGGSNTNVVATFSRADALDHEEIEFLSFGHPLVDQALDWAREANDASAALALLRGQPVDGAVFLWSFGLDVPDDAPEVMTYFDQHHFTFALDESGKRRPEFEGLLEEPDVTLDRMDAAPLQNSIGRWRGLVEQNYAASLQFADQALEELNDGALEHLAAVMERRARHLRQLHRRELSHLKASGADPTDINACELAFADKLHAFECERERLKKAIHNARTKLHAAVAVRLVKARRVSG